ncbi:hypothetical protein AB0H43_36815 [Hamadaea sp. NPDC050747]|uniref:hypothetical protein n=1 Tax=Hamadaea sp. NPDC050747 TaxID=3155789 RepID=UPI0033DC98AC
MSTDIYGYIEVRDPLADQDWFDWEPWSVACPLHPLLAQNDYDAFACLFGVRNYAGWRPVAAGRGIPPDASTQVREEFAGFLDDESGATWVAWSELNGLDMTVGPDGVPGRLTLTEGGHEMSWPRRDRWPAEILDRFGLLPWGPTPGETFGVIQTDGATLAYQPLTRAKVLGPGSGWEHVFAVMRALAGRFGADGVRLVVHFD